MQQIISSTVCGFCEKTLSLTTPQKKKSIGGWGLVIVVAIPLALVDLSTCWVIVHQETYALLWHSVEELHLVERSHHYHAVSVIVVTVSLGMLRYRLCVTVLWKRICPSTPLHERPAQTVIPTWFNCPSSVTWGFFCWIVDTVVLIYSTWKLKMSFVRPHKFYQRCHCLVFRHSEPLRRIVNGDPNRPLITYEAIWANKFSNLNVALDDSKINWKCLT